MFDIFLTTLPVFLLVGLGYGGTRSGLFAVITSKGLMAYALKLAVPCLLFRAVSTLDLAEVFRPGLLISFYAAALTSFGIATIGARMIFQRRPGESVVIGFGALFSNCFLLGIPIMERAFGAESTAPNFAIIAIHSPFCYLVGILCMEIFGSTPRGPVETGRAVVRALIGNPLMIGIALGFTANLTHLPVPGAVRQVVDMVAQSAFPVALFAMGGILTEYRLRSSLGIAGMVAGLSLLVHPGLAWLLGTQVFHLPTDFLRSLVVTASMPTGVNAYVFASLYNRSMDAAAGAVLLATALSVVTVTAWIAVLP